MANKKAMSGLSKSRGRRLLKHRRRQTTGSVPGQIIVAKDAGKPVVTVFAYGPADCQQQDIQDLDSIARLRQEYPFIWLDVVEFGDVELIARIGELFGLHRLALEDAVNTHQRPKVEEYEGHLFVIALMLRQSDFIETEQIAMFLGKDYLITFQEKQGDCFGAIRTRLSKPQSRIRTTGADYLCYALLDAIIDGYFPVLEQCGDRLEDLEDDICSNPDTSEVGDIHHMKRDLLLLRRAIWPHREMINQLVRDEHNLFSAATRPFLRDCYDHTVQLMDIVETYREIASGLVDVYMSSISVKLNEVMKVLTIVATLFMPLSFIASLYGMNFNREKSPFNMPELDWYLGYPFALLLMAASAGGLLYYMRRKGWLRSKV